MKIELLRKMEYEKHWIHIMHFGNFFQYLFADKKGNIYQHYITLTPNLLHLLKYKLGIEKQRFSREEREVGEQIVLSGAMTSIDALIAGEKNITKEVPKETIQHKKKTCAWCAMEIDGFMKWKCLDHDIAVDMIDGVKPFHEIGILSPIQFA